MTRRATKLLEMMKVSVICLGVLCILQCNQALVSSPNDVRIFKYYTINLDLIDKSFQSICPNGPNGIFAHPTFCRLFVKCTQGDPEFFHCVDGKLFDSVDLTCEEEDLVNCGSRPFYYFNTKGPITMESYRAGKASNPTHWHRPPLKSQE